MKIKYAWFGALIVLVLALIFIKVDAQIPPLPTPVVGLEWDANAANEQPVTYYVYQSTNVTGPYTVVSETTNLTVGIVVPAKGQYYWYVVASNYWGLSLPSNVVNTPAPSGKVNNTKIKPPQY